jgi:hypothetical protein
MIKKKLKKMEFLCGTKKRENLGVQKNQPVLFYLAHPVWIRCTRAYTESGKYPVPNRVKTE